MAGLVLSTEGVGAPATWLLMGHKAGDNAQLLALAEALGWPFETRHFTYRRTELLTNRLLGPTLAGIVPDRSTPLGPPWPQLILTAGRRNEPIARWIRRTAAGRTPVKLVHLGRPWAALAEFDLIITTPQYHLPDRPNILHIEAPLHRLPVERLHAAADELRHELGELQPPYLVALLGGDAGTYRLDRENARLLAHHLTALAVQMNGSLLVSTSRRTPTQSLEAFRAGLLVSARIFEWSSENPSPYLGLLGLADRIVVTVDSVSMVTEAIATGKPVYIFDLSKGKTSERPLFPANGSIRPAGILERLEDARWPQIVNGIAAAVGPHRMLRDLRKVSELQVDQGRATWLGQEREHGDLAVPFTDLERATQRVHQLFL